MGEFYIPGDILFMVVLVYFYWKLKIKLRKKGKELHFIGDTVEWK